MFTLFRSGVSVDASWLLLAVLIASTLAGSAFPALTPEQTPATRWMMALAAAAGLLLSTVTHATALMARLYGLPLRGITLFIFGGVAGMPSEPGRPREGALLAAAGPVGGPGLAAVVRALSGTVTVAPTGWKLSR